MSERESWMPSDHAIREACAASSWGERGKIMDLIRSAVSKREAELEERHARKTKALRNIADSARTLRAKLSSVYKSDAYLAVWSLAQAHGHNYPSDPSCNWIAEQEALDAALAALAALDAEPKS